MNTIKTNVDIIESSAAQGQGLVRSEAALNDFLHHWRAGTLPKNDWTHAAHVAVGACYVFDYPADEALEKIRAGIIHYNTCVGTANTDHSGYHETLTRFWTGLIRNLLATHQSSSRLEFVSLALGLFAGDSALFRRYYSFDVVNDARARREWIAPDCQPGTDVGA
jgi:hypothetical protein